MNRFSLLAIFLIGTAAMGQQITHLDCTTDPGDDQIENYWLAQQFVTDPYTRKVGELWCKIAADSDTTFDPALITGKFGPAVKGGMCEGCGGQNIYFPHIPPKHLQLCGHEQSGEDCWELPEGFQLMPIIPAIPGGGIFIQDARPLLCTYCTQIPQKATD